jgi:hypothetical protein
MTTQYLGANRRYTLDNPHPQMGQPTTIADAIKVAAYRRGHEHGVAQARRDAQQMPPPLAGQGHEMGIKPISKMSAAELEAHVSQLRSKLVEAESMLRAAQPPRSPADISRDAMHARIRDGRPKTPVSAATARRRMIARKAGR